ncbi:ECF-type sigma factor [Haliangium sp.]|uniref:ECF-type sigma factor n=1 Tax=Haliangium sp. TaxID=2663208 RepID=UPI003D0E7B20
MSTPPATAPANVHIKRLYDKLHRMAVRHFRHQSPGVTLQATALVHEVYLRLVRQGQSAFTDGEHLLAVAATAMRQILVDQARRRRAGKRGGAWERLPFGEDAPAPRRDALDVLTLDEVLTRLSDLHPRQAKVVELRVFGGMTVSEVAAELAVSPSTVEKDWRQARAWMRCQLAPTEAV